MSRLPRGQRWVRRHYFAYKDSLTTGAEPDYREIDRVYLPQDMLARHGARVEQLAEPAAPPALRACIRDVAERNAELVAHGRRFSPQVRDRRLRLETAIIGQLAAKLNGWLLARDPLSQPVHLSKAGAIWQALLGAGTSLVTPRSAVVGSHATADGA